MTTLSLHDARQLAEFSANTSVSSRVPTVKQLRNGESEVIVSEQINANTFIALYKNGYVLYTADDRSTVYALPKEMSYDYYSVAGSSAEHIDDNFFEEQPWYLRLMLEGEDKLCYNQRLRDANLGTFNYSDVSELYSTAGKIKGNGDYTPKHVCKYRLPDNVAGSSLEDKRVRMLEDVIEKEGYEERLSEIQAVLTEKQFRAFQLNKIKGISQEEVGRQMNISQQAVNKLINTAIKKLHAKMRIAER